MCDLVKKGKFLEGHGGRIKEGVELHFGIIFWIDLFGVFLDPRFSLGFWKNPSIVVFVLVAQYPP
jgi:hypothetical protein